MNTNPRVKSHYSYSDSRQSSITGRGKSYQYQFYFIK